MKSTTESIVRKRFACLPFRGEKPFEIILSPVNHHHRPRALVSQELFSQEHSPALTYQIAITCQQEEYNRFVFQYSHELAHFYLTPYCHAFLEVCAVAVSLSSLRLCGEEWIAIGRHPGSYAAKFQSYRARVEAGAGNDREIANGALLATNVLDVFPCWRPLTSLAQCLVDESRVDFTKWLALNNNDQADWDFVNKVVHLFASEFGS
ncbi:hypothetical protein BASA81_010042 [Batrachochytrium salamandrivorans]|nr:hypothetical protein BASA81_010042 [Batrachochytrium salamandrivorans]